MTAAAVAANSLSQIEAIHTPFGFRLNYVPRLLRRDHSWEVGIRRNKLAAAMHCPHDVFYGSMVLQGIGTKHMRKSLTSFPSAIRFCEQLRCKFGFAS